MENICFVEVHRSPQTRRLTSSFLTIREGCGRPNFCWWLAREVLPQVSPCFRPCPDLPGTHEKLARCSPLESFATGLTVLVVSELEQLAPVFPGFVKRNLNSATERAGWAVKTTRFRTGRDLPTTRVSSSPCSFSCISRFDMTDKRLVNSVA